MVAAAHVYAGDLVVAFAADADYGVLAALARRVEQHEIAKQVARARRMEIRASRHQPVLAQRAPERLERAALVRATQRVIIQGCRHSHDPR